MSSNSQAPKYSEYKIKSFLQSTNYHVMLMPEKGGGALPFSEFVPPVRLYRNSKDAISEASPPMDGEENLASSNPRLKRRSQIITHFESPTQKALKAEEAAPWVLEDGDGKSYSSRLEGGQQQKYVLFGAEFRVLLVNKWYRFSPRLSLSTNIGLKEEAENTRKLQPTTRLEQIVMKKEAVVEIDEEERPDHVPDTLTIAGREMRKTLRHLDKSNLYQSDEDESEVLPEDSLSYSSEEDERTENVALPLEKKEVPEVVAKVARVSLPASSVGHDSMLLTDADILPHLQNGPIKVKDLILLLKGPLKANPSNKELFKELVKKLCVVKLGQGDDEKWLSIKK
ncbi:hypothetical protein DI09_7p100 [Mitosporidium daphniae]|uniref:Uncharacterized protein n=1 Tax=Mitosporidium daphniae TaxID=1485682 RepID=A0A098VR56_9MICR|nr:uncharacterized protein DI09_7p100 [Mitosporidium daphniae]KGG50231.1 hypothetical protein DI09_7p100 [Mitosporidium daphniae]|eukprot:XP_013236658.1 uncharacterized protein DI09_7p100 [Mitosporidium daphniae]